MKYEGFYITGRNHSAKTSRDKFRPSARQRHKRESSPAESFPFVFRRVFGVLLAGVLLGSALPASVFAEEAEEAEALLSDTQTASESEDTLSADIDASSQLTDAVYTVTSSGEIVEVSWLGFETAIASGNEEAYYAILNAQTRSFYWDGSVLTADAGVNYGPSGKETWYSLDMSTCIQTMRDYGIAGDLWVRADGCQMYGIYLLIAANYDEYPLGTVVETSLGTGIVADTGSFTGLIDIATTW